MISKKSTGSQHEQARFLFMSHVAWRPPREKSVLETLAQFRKIKKKKERESNEK